MTSRNFRSRESTCGTCSGAPSDVTPLPFKKANTYILFNFIFSSKSLLRWHFVYKLNFVAFKMFRKSSDSFLIELPFTVLCSFISFHSLRWQTSIKRLPRTRLKASLIQQIEWVFIGQDVDEHFRNSGNLFSSKLITNFYFYCIFVAAIYLIIYTTSTERTSLNS